MLPKADAKDLVGRSPGVVPDNAAKGVIVSGSDGDSISVVSMICPGGVMSGSTGCVVLWYQRCGPWLNRVEAHCGGVTILWPIGDLGRKPSDEATFLSRSLMVSKVLNNGVEQQ